MRLTEFRKNRGLVDEIKKLFSTPDWRYLRTALDEEHPMHDHLTLDQSPGALARQLGRIEGYQQCLKNLESAVMYVEPPKPIAETFEPIKPPTVTNRK